MCVMYKLQKSIHLNKYRTSTNVLEYQRLYSGVTVPEDDADVSAVGG